MKDKQIKAKIECLSDSFFSCRYHLNKDFEKTYCEVREYLLKDSTNYKDPFYRIIRKNPFNHFQELANKKIIISFTSYPKRIFFVEKMLQSILNQSLNPDEIVMWLSKEEFPRKTENLPENLLSLIKSNSLQLRWCEGNLKPHKKYFYAFQNYKDDILITIDDDLFYRKDMIKSLFLSYLEHPDCISASRTHIIKFKNGEFAPYNEWIYENNQIINIPSMELFATNGAGSLFPPGLLKMSLLNEKLINELCLNADDLWLKTLEVISDVATVQVSKEPGLLFIPESQSESLWFENKGNNMNDIQLNKIKLWANKEYSEHYLENKILNKNNKYYLSLYDYYQILNNAIEEKTENGEISIKHLFIGKIKKYNKIIYNNIKREKE